jgi:hypothetical protein
MTRTVPDHVSSKDISVIPDPDNFLVLLDGEVQGFVQEAMRGDPGWIVQQFPPTRGLVKKYGKVTYEWRD